MNNIVDKALQGDTSSFDVSRKLGALSLVLTGEDPTNAVIATDKVLFTALQAVAAEKEQSSNQDIVENLIDRAAVYVTVWAQQKCIALCEAGGAKLGAAIGGLFGPKGAIIGEKAGQWVGRQVGRALKPAVERGVQILADTAKSIWNDIKSAGRTIRDKVVGWLGL